jgi:hypothetical protein
MYYYLREYKISFELNDVIILQRRKKMELVKEFYII